ncbi:MAG: IS1634 family transposase [bacterium]|jgi:transposase
MATIQARASRGNKYWYIVESRRVNGKPRPIMLAYLGKANDLLKRLQGMIDRVKLKSYSHGAIAALLKISEELDVCNIINKHIESKRKNIAKYPIRNNLTAGATFLLAAISRLCMPTSKSGFYDWAKNTSLEYLLKTNLSKVDSQHFWDLMDALPADNIELIEQELLKKVFETYKIDTNSLFFDTTNFFTYIHTTNEKCSIAKRGKNKQKRADLRQIGLAMVVAKESMIPLFHLTYEGNRHDSVIFSSVIQKLKKRMAFLNMDIKNHTVVFDRGNNSKKNLDLIKINELHYVGALVPYQHKELVKEAFGNLDKTEIENSFHVYRNKKKIWGEERTVVAFISDGLKAGQIGWIYNLLDKAKKKLADLQNEINKKPAQDKDKLEQKITKIIEDKKINDLINWSLDCNEGKYQINYLVDKEKLKAIEDELGIRILMTDRHDWSTEEIIKAYHGQAFVEQAFKNLKNPYHLAIRPQFHWTDQKIKVHYFICVLGYLLATLLWKQAKENINFTGTLDNFLDYLNNIRLAVMLESGEKRGNVKATYKLEEPHEDESALIKEFAIDKYHIEKRKLSGVGVYT